MKEYYLGVDLGGTSMSAAVIDQANGKMLGLENVPTLARQGSDAVITRMAALVEASIRSSGIAREEILGVGIGAPGMLDMQRGETLFLTNFAGNWPHVPLTARIQASTGLPVALINDVRAMTFGEWRFGAGQGVDNLACFAIGTGIGGGLVLDGHLHLGLMGTAGELGHISLDPNGPVCGCGNRGCLETFSSGPAITAAALKVITQGLTTSMAQMVGGDLNKVTPRLVAEAAQAGDPFAKAIFEEAGFYLGMAIVNVLVTVSPQRIVIGGGVAQAGDLLFEPMRRTVYDRTHVVPIEEIEILPAALGIYAGLVGASAWAAYKFKSR